jgi:hypothetical protein
MPEPIDGLYFNWLRAKVVDHRWPTHMYLDLLKILYGTEFVWTLIGDKNREDDGLELRLDFLRESRVESEPYWFESPCSVLEVLLALAKRAEFVTEMPVKDWFWVFLTNLRLDGCRTVSRSEKLLVDRALETWMFRIYDPSGYGGLFPMREPKEDQTQLELWYQFNRYIDDQGL